MSEEVKVAKSLIVKLCEAGQAIGWIPKSGVNEFHHYKYATEADLVSALRGELYQRNVFLFPSLVSAERKPITVVTKNGQRETALTDVIMDWTFVDGDSGETYRCQMPGCGEDSGDKGVYKAMTGSEKYLLMKAFLVPTGDDPENDAGDREQVKHTLAANEQKFQDKVAKDLKGKTVVIVPAKKPIGNGDEIDIVYFQASETLAMLLDAGLGAVTIFDDRARMRWVADDPETRANIEAFAKEKGVTFVRKDLLSVPAAKPEAASLPQKQAASGPILKSVSDIQKGKKYQFFSVEWDSKKIGCFHCDWQPYLLESVGKPAYLKIVQNGQYWNLEEVFSTNGVIWHDGAPTLQQELR